MANVDDVARAAKVSKATVSYAFSDNPEKLKKLSPATRERILTCAAQLNYTPSIFGRSISLRRTFTAALVFPQRCAINISTHYVRMFQGAARAANRDGYNLCIFFGIDASFMLQVERKRFDGVILIGSMCDTAQLRELLAIPLPLVAVNRLIPAAADRVCVLSDNAGWLRGRIDDFQRRGHRRVLWFSMRDNADYICNFELLQTWDSLAAPLNLPPRLGADKTDFPTAFAALLRRRREWDALILKCYGDLVDLFFDVAAQMRLRPGIDFPVCITAGVSTPLQQWDRVHHQAWEHDSDSLGQLGWRQLKSLLDGVAVPPQTRVPYISVDTYLESCQHTMNLDF